jgi:hypothetical protein
MFLYDTELYLCIAIVDANADQLLHDIVVPSSTSQPVKRKNLLFIFNTT